MSIPEVFIIESLNFDDEKADRFDGKIIRDMLNFHKKKCTYYYIRTKKELVEILKEFARSNYRYLHLSCHGNSSTVGLTLDSLSYGEFGDLVAPYIKDKRLFISACNIMNEKFSYAIFSRAKGYSLMGTMTEVPFMDSAIFWQAFYHIMFRLDRKKMQRKEIIENANKLAGLFEVKIGYSYPKSKSEKFSFRDNHRLRKLDGSPLGEED